MTPLVYTKPNCPACRATHRELHKKEINYTEINLEANEEERARLQELGFTQMPVVFANGEYWTGYRPDKIAGLAE